MTGCTIEFADQGGGVFGQRIHVISRIRNFAPGLAAMVVTDAAKAWAQGFHLLTEHLAAHQQAVGKDYGIRTGPRNLLVNPGAVDCFMGHDFSC